MYNNIEEYIATNRSQIEEKLKSLFLSEQLEIYKAARYLLLAPCKRIRPLLVLALCETLSPSNKEKALLPAVAIELVHTYSLIHDDLPCMDNDDFRRNQPSMHKKYPEWMALLCGDFLLTKAFELIAQADISNEKKIDLIKILTKASGEYGLIQGQVLDLSYKEPDAKQKEEINQKKTASLFTACIQFAAILCNASQQQREELNNFSLDLGLSFQYFDDYKDEDTFDKKEKALLWAEKLYTKAFSHLSFEHCLLKDLCDKLFFKQTSMKI